MEEVSKNQTKVYIVKFFIQLYGYLGRESFICVFANDKNEAKNEATKIMEKLFKNFEVLSVSEIKEPKETNTEFRIEIVSENDLYRFSYNEESFETDKKYHLNEYKKKLTNEHTKKCSSAMPIPGYETNIYKHKQKFPEYLDDNFFFLLKNGYVYILGIISTNPFIRKRGKTIEYDECYDFVSYSKQIGFILYKNCYSSFHYEFNRDLKIIYTPECLSFKTGSDIGLPIVQEKLYNEEDFEQFVLNVDRLNPSRRVVECSFINDKKVENTKNNLAYFSVFNKTGPLIYNLIHSNNKNLYIYIFRLLYLLEENAINDKSFRYKDLKNYQYQLKRVAEFLRTSDYEFLRNEPNLSLSKVQISVKLVPELNFFVLLYIFKDNPLIKLKLIKRDLYFVFDFYENQIDEIGLFESHVKTLTMDALSSNITHKKNSDNSIFKSEKFLQCIEPNRPIYGTNDYEFEIKKHYDILLKNVIDEYKDTKYRIRWYHEFVLFIFIKYLFSDAVFQYSPPFLEGLVYDVYVPSLQCAIEYQGEQHYRNISYHELTVEEVQERDKKKKELSTKNNVKLLAWDCEWELSLLFVKQKLEGLLNQKIELKDETSLNKQYYLKTFCLSDDVKVKKQKPVKKLIICQYNKNGDLLREFDTSEEAAKSIGITAKALMKSYNAFEGYRLAGGFLWKKCLVEEKKDKIKPYFFENIDYESLRILCLDDNGEIVQVFGSHKSAAKFAGVDTSTLKDCLCGIQKTAGQFHWKYLYKHKE